MPDDVDDPFQVLEDREYTAWAEALLDARCWCIKRGDAAGSEFFRLWLRSLGGSS